MKKWPCSSDHNQIPQESSLIFNVFIYQFPRNDSNTWMHNIQSSHPQTLSRCFPLSRTHSSLTIIIGVIVRKPPMFGNSRLHPSVWQGVEAVPRRFYRAELAATWTPRQQLIGRGSHVAAMSAQGKTKKGATRCQVVTMTGWDHHRCNDGNAFFVVIRGWIQPRPFKLKLRTERWTRIWLHEILK